MSFSPTGSRAAQTAPKIWHLTLDYPPESLGGIGTQVYELANGLGQSGCPVTVLVPTTQEVKVETSGAATVHWLPMSSLRQRLARRAESASSATRATLNQVILDYGDRLFISDERPDLIHCHDDLIFAAAHQLGRRFGVPVVCTCHFLHIPLREWWGEQTPDEIAQSEQAMLANADMIIAVSHSLRSIIAGTYKVPQERLQVVHNGLDARPFQPAALNPALRARLRQTLAPADAPLVLFAGRLDQQKGLDALFAAADLVLEELPAVRYLIVGETATSENDNLMQTLAVQYPRVQRQTRFLGRVPRAQLAQLYQVADLALVPSVYEPFGYAALEAIAAGVPVVATAVGGLAEIIEHGQTGWLVPVHAPPSGRHQVDVTALAAAQIELLHDRALGRRLAASAQASVIERFALPAMTAATLEVYHRVLVRERAVSRQPGYTRASSRSKRETNQ